MDAEEARRILGITQADDAHSARMKFRRLIGQYHPDAAGEQETAKRLNAAYAALKAEGFFTEGARTREGVPDTFQWEAVWKEDAYLSRPIYAPYHADLAQEAEGLFQTLGRGKYLWNPEEEPFPLFLRSIYRVVRELLDGEEGRVRFEDPEGDGRASCEKKLFHFLMMQFIDPVACLFSLAKPEQEEESGRVTFRIRAFLGESRDRALMRRILSLTPGERIFPAALKNGRLLVCDGERNALGHVSLAEDSLYYCLYPLMKAHRLQVRLEVRSVRRTGGRNRGRAEAELVLLCRMEPGARDYQTPDMNPHIRAVLTEYRAYLEKEKRKAGFC